MSYVKFSAVRILFNVCATLVNATQGKNVGDLNKYVEMALGDLERCACSPLPCLSAILSDSRLLCEIYRVDSQKGGWIYYTQNTTKIWSRSKSWRSMRYSVVSIQEPVLFPNVLIGLPPTDTTKWCGDPSEKIRKRSRTGSPTQPEPGIICPGRWFIHSSDCGLGGPRWLAQP